MDPQQITPEALKHWDPYAFWVLATLLSGLVGGAMVWLSTKGMDAYIRWREFKRKERSEDEKRQKSQALIDRILENKNAAEGYKSMLLIYDARCRALEDKDITRTQELQNLHTAYVECIGKHATEEARAERLEGQLEDTTKRCAALEQLCERMRLKLLKIAPPGIDPMPSPLPYDGENPDKK
jgi:hypothetical protein